MHKNVFSKRGISPIILLVLIVFILSLYMIKPFQESEANLASILLEKYSDYTKRTISLVVTQDNYRTLEDAIRFYSFSLEKLNLSGDNNKLKVLDRIKTSAITGIPKEDYDAILTNLWMDNMPPPIIFRKSLMEDLSFHLEEVRKHLPGNYQLRICQYFFVNDRIYSQLTKLNSSLLKKNKVFLCINNKTKSTDSENKFCSVSLANYMPDYDLDGDGIPNKDDCDEDGDGVQAYLYNYFGKKCNGTDIDDNGDGIYDKLGVYKYSYNVSNFTITLPVWENITINITNTTNTTNITTIKVLTYKDVNYTGNLTLYLPGSLKCGQPFSFDIENPLVYDHLNPFYLFIMPLESKPNPDDKYISIEDEFDYDNSYFYVLLAPIEIFYKVWLDSYNYNELNIYYPDMYSFFDIGIYRQTSICDGNLTIGC